MRVCCKITSLIQMAYGSVVSRHGMLRPFSLNQRSKASVKGLLPMSFSFFICWRFLFSCCWCGLLIHSQVTEKEIIFPL